MLERTPKYRTSNTPNIECPNIELSEHHILAQNRTSNMLNITKNQTCLQTSNCLCQDLSSHTTRPNFEHFQTSHDHILVQNQTSNMSNITKNRTVRENRTVRSKTNTNIMYSKLNIINNTFHREQ